MNRRCLPPSSDDEVRVIVADSIERYRQRLAAARAVCRPKPVALKPGWERRGSTVERRS